MPGSKVGTEGTVVTPVDTVPPSRAIFILLGRPLKKRRELEMRILGMYIRETPQNV